MLWGNDYLRGIVDDDALLRIMNAHARIAEVDTASDGLEMLDVVTRIAYEQFPYQVSQSAEVSRSRALLVDGLGEVATTTFTAQPPIASWAHRSGRWSARRSCSMPGFEPRRLGQPGGAEQFGLPGHLRALAA